MIRIGVIGTGRLGTRHAQHFAGLERCTVTAVADPNEEAAQAIAQELGAQAFTDCNEMFDEIDAAVIASPNFLHAEQAIACANAGKHVWIEKPMALTTADADRIVAAVEAHGVKSFVGFSVRFEGVIRTMQRLFDEGQVGDLVSIWSRRMSYSRHRNPESWRHSHTASGGFMSELLAHEIDWIVAIAGLPTSVYCRIATRVADDPRANEHVWMTLAFGPKASGMLEGSAMSFVPDYYRGVTGTEGGIYTQDWGRALVLSKGRDDSTALELDPSLDKYAHFLDVIEERCPSQADAAWGRSVVMVGEKALDSAVSGAVEPLLNVE
jgi:predicted dehydrogenase